MGRRRVSPRCSDLWCRAGGRRARSPTSKGQVSFYWVFFFGVGGRRARSLTFKGQIIRLWVVCAQANEFFWVFPNVSSRVFVVLTVLPNSRQSLTIVSFFLFFFVSLPLADRFAEELAVFNYYCFSFFLFSLFFVSVPLADRFAEEPAVFDEVEILKSPSFFFFSTIHMYAHTYTVIHSYRSHLHKCIQKKT